MPDNQPLNSTRTPDADKKEKGRHIAMRLAFSVLLLAVAVLGVLLYLAKQKLIFRDPPEPTPAPVLCRAVCYTPKGEPMILSVEQGGTLRLPTGDAIEHYTFIGWADEKGNLLDENELKRLTVLANNIANNINQIAHRANVRNKVYKEDIEEIKELGDKLWRPLMFLQTKVAQLKH